MAKSARIGVVIPCYRVARFINETVASVRAQTHQDWLAVVVDDGSPDDIFDAVRPHLSDERVRYVCTSNQGVSAARNRGFRELDESIDYVMFLDGDDRLSPPALATLAAELGAHPNSALVHCEPRQIDENGAPLPAQGWMPRLARSPRGWVCELPASGRDITPFESIYTIAGVIPSLTLYRRSMLAETPLFDEAFGQTGEDSDLTFEVALRGEARHVPERLVDYRRHEDQCSRDESRLARQLPRLYRKWCLRTDLPPEWRERVQAAERFRTGPLAVRLALITGKRALRERRPSDILRAVQALVTGIAKWIGS